MAAPARTPRAVPTRTCVACRTARAKNELLRIVRTPTGEVLVDPTGRQAGRGAYLCRAADCLTIARRKGALGRALEIKVPSTLLERLEAGTDTNHDTDEGGARGQE